MTIEELINMGCRVLDITDAYPIRDSGSFAIGSVYNDEEVPETYRVALVIVEETA